MNRIEQRFRANASAGRRALLPYFTSGYPDFTTSLTIVRRADALGATVVEIGIPYSDSVADGPVIQESFNYVLQRGWKLEDSFNLVSELRPSVQCAVVAMVSYTLVYRLGVDTFMARAADAGFDGVIVPDLPVEESAGAVLAAQRVNLCHIGLVAPTTSAARREAIARTSTGFIYEIAVAGITGERRSLSPTLAEDVARLRDVSGLPVCVGFGISTAEHVREVCAVADGAIVGSAIIRRITDALDQGLEFAALPDLTGSFLEELMAGVTPETT